MLHCSSGILEGNCLVEYSNGILEDDCLLDCILEGNKEYDEIPLLDCNDVDVELTVLLVDLGLSGDWFGKVDISSFTLA